ncbi:acetyltransferase (GNAT) family protein [Paenibacillus taihuensis]|uniref:Acetyltransferase (GNAT) family protein n=1 Tax=Paenibacillus taihuensis TaxID=1156355 RepID=A0A3D9Q0J3_9BACL|nr:GNAT family N-acetyltransferase [Paenibacillus taihuensis]REE55446.1 acetyltransferase (GNAT) family protein [Paenibacillus taihuensis]
MNLKSKIVLRALQPELIADINRTNEPFTLFGRVVPQLQNGKWTYEELLFDESKETRFPDDRLNWDDYIDQENKALFLAYDGQACVGQIRIVRDWTRYGYIENIATVQAYRGRGVGKLLLDQAEAWAMDRQLLGLSLEAQDDNLAACRFYAKHGFMLGGADTLKQAGNPNIDTTLYWYRLFSQQC